MPQVTILMPTYNVASYIDEAIDSVLRQRYRDFVLLVVDDASTDGTWERVCRYDDPRIRRVRHDSNLGLADNLNSGLALVETEYTARMDGDDIAEPDWLKSEVEFLDTHPDIGICGGGCEVFGSKNHTVLFPADAPSVAVNMLFECSLTVPTFRTSLIREYGLHYRDDAFPAEDYRFWVDCLQVTNICNIPRVLFHYRMHERQISTALHDRQQQQSDAVRRIMLHRLNSNISDSDTDYFLQHYVPGKVSSLADYRAMRRFSRRLIDMNRGSGYFNAAALRQRCRHQEVQTLYQFVTQRYFPNGYSLRAYLRYLFSGCAWRTTLHYETRFLIKSILHRSA